MSGASEAGFSLVEVLVALAIVAAVTLTMVSSLVPRRAEPPSAEKDLERTLLAARSQAILSGRAIAVWVEGAEVLIWPDGTRSGEVHSGTVPLAARD